MGLWGGKTLSFTHCLRVAGYTLAVALALMCVSHGYRLTLLAHPDQRDRQAVTHCHMLAVSLSYIPMLFAHTNTLRPEREKNNAIAERVAIQYSVQTQVR